jgi:uncharacterized protein (TIGR00730 family)
MNVTVFGGAQPIPGDPAYEEARRLGTLLAQNGHCVLTGGYIGTMEAVSRGANEAGGHVIGVTCTQIEAWRNVRANQWVKEERHHESLRERLFGLIDGCDAALVLPGGVGTLVELSLVWNELIIGALTPRPLILIGPGWQAVVSTFFDQLGSYVPERMRSLISFASTIEDAAAMLEPARASQK